MWNVSTLCITIAANIADTALLAIPACFPDSVVGFVADEKLCEVKYVHFFIKSIKNQLTSYAPATAQKNINLVILRNLAVPLASKQEQQKIVEEVERMFSVADETERMMIINIKLSFWLRQSILKKAFEGELAPQDSSDESAELLERIRAERMKLNTEDPNHFKQNRTVQRELARYV